MEDVIELLREVEQPRYASLELPDEDLLVEIEEQLYISLPSDLRTFLLEVSDLIIGSLEPVTVTDSGLHTYLPEVAANAWDQGVPRHLIPICQVYGHVECDEIEGEQANVNTDKFYCIEKDGEISLWQGRKQIQNDDNDMLWPSIWHWAKEIWLSH